ncbi:MAG: DUF6290 family protein [Streptococcaceae bacterium]|nr:DUF6290 family protein [Streptococcaceae bacterium]
MTFTSVRLNDTQCKVMKEFAELHGKSLSTMLKEALEAQIEEAYDLKMVEEARKEDDGTRYTLEEMRHRYGL